jgi:hypothetical protein
MLLRSATLFFPSVSPSPICFFLVVVPTASPTVTPTEIPTGSPTTGFDGGGNTDRGCGGSDMMMGVVAQNTPVFFLYQTSEGEEGWSW